MTEREQFNSSPELSQANETPTILPPVLSGEIIITPGTNGVIYDAKKEKDMRHNKNLHGEGRFVDGLTGYYHNKYYRNGRHEPNKRKR